MRDMVIKEFEKDSKIFFDLRMNCGLDVKSSKCRKCDYESHSEGLLRLHKERDHQIKQTFQNVVLGFKCDVRSHVVVLKSMDEPTDTLKCDSCEFKTCSFGEMEVHRKDHHEKY